MSERKGPELYELTGAYADASVALMACETDDEYEEALKAFDEIEGALTDKSAGMARILRNLQARASVQKAQEEAFKAEAARLTARRKASESAAERLKERVLYAMETAGLERIRTDIGTWYIGSSIRVDVTDPNKVPSEFVRGYTPEIDKAAAKKHYEYTGEIIDGIEFVHGRTAKFR